MAINRKHRAKTHYQGDHHYKNYRLMSVHRVPLKKQTGAALLALVLLIVIGSTFFLVSKLNTNIALTQRSEETGAALSAAKEALIGYAITYPDKVNPDEGPGYLPCPDIDNDGDAEGICSLGGVNDTIGRLPYETLELEDLRDGSGQRFWYALSENFRNNPKIVPLNSESPASAQLSVNGRTDIVAIIFAPGEPFDNQNRTAGPNNVANYLEDDNSDFDTSFITSVNNPNINDRLIVITRQELMQAVEKRVLGEVRKMMIDYFSDHGAYPWLAPFADPKASKAPFSGSHNGGNNSASLSDSSRDFTVLGVANGDTVRNFTDGSIGIVSAVTATTLNVVGPFLGTDNDYDDNDEYAIYPAALSGQLTGTATNANDSDSLQDTTNDFDELGISPGDVVDNLTNNCRGVVDTVAATELTFLALTGCAESDFDNGDNYKIRSHQGQATAGSNSLTLNDVNNDFIVMGVQVGDIILNMTDGSVGRVSSVVDADTLTVDELNFGSNNLFTVNDYYSLPRFNTDGAAREGLLSFHEVGEAFKTALVFDWTISASPGDITVTNSTLLQTYMQNYAAAGSETFDNTVGTCIWLLADIADCYGRFRDFVSISGGLTSGLDTPVITDTNAQFITDGVKRGDIAMNYDDESFVISGIADAGSSGTTLIDAAANFSGYERYSYVIQNDTLEVDLGAPKIQGVVADIVDANTLVAESYLGESVTPIEFRPGDSYAIYQPQKFVVETVSSETQLTTDNYVSSANPDFDYFSGPVLNPEYYRIIPAGNSYTGTITIVNSIGAIDTFTDATADFISEGITVGDVIETNIAGINVAFGEITAVTATSITTTLYTDLGLLPEFIPGNSYTIYHDYVYSREHTLHTRFRGNQVSKTLAEQRARDVCLGYSADCTTVSAAVNFSGNGGGPFITVVDYEEDETTQAGQATFTPSAASSGSIRVSNIDFNLAASNGDIPDWFITNKWHQFIYLAYSVGDSPNGGAPCTVAGADCLTLTGGGQPVNNKRALIISAGSPLALQDRTSGAIGDYYENENNDAGDDDFQTGEITGAFNDQIRILDTSP